MLRHCPSCARYVSINENDTEGICLKCGEAYRVKHTLSDIKLVLISTTRYSFSQYQVNQVIKFISKRKTYMAEISKNVGITEGQVRTIVRDLLNEDKIKVETTKRIKYISLK